MKVMIEGEMKLLKEQNDLKHKKIRDWKEKEMTLDLKYRKAL